MDEQAINSVWMCFGGLATLPLIILLLKLGKYNENKARERGQHTEVIFWQKDQSNSRYLGCMMILFIMCAGAILALTLKW